MPDNGSPLLEPSRCTPWNKGKLIGAKPPLRPKHVWAIRTRLMVEGRTRDLAMFNLAIDSKLRACEISYVNNLPRASETPERKFRAGINDGFAAPCFDMRCRSMQCDGPKAPALAKPHDAELCLADAGGVLQHRLEHWVQRARRPGDDLQYLGGRGLLFQRLAEFAC
jgi:hypothetical protein